MKHSLLLLLLLMGCNHSAPVVQGHGVVFIGDSITHLWDLQHAFPGQEVVDKGIPGENSQQILARFDEDVIKLHPRVVVITAGTNDIAQHRYLYLAAWRVQRMAKLAAENGIIPIVCTLPPMEDERRAKGVQELNSMLRKKGFRECDYQAALSDADGKPLTGVLKADGVHPSEYGYSRMREALHLPKESSSEARNKFGR